jgi:hypothetical protein
MIQYFSFRQLFILCLLFLLPAPALAVLTVNMNFSGNNSFLLSGKDLQDVVRIEATLSYDASSLANPRLTPNTYFPDATVTMNEDNGGTVRLIVASGKPMKGKGPFAMLTFNPVGTSVGAITSFYGRVYGAKGASLPANFSYTNPTPPLDPSDPDDWPIIKERESKGQTYMGGGVAYLPPEAAAAIENSKESEESKEANDAVTATEENTAEQTADPQEYPTKEKTPETPEAPAQSVLERFRLFEGERSAKNLIALFEAAPDASFKQEPSILLADGKKNVRLTISKVDRGKAPNFAFTAARFVSCKKLSKNKWLVEARPNEGALNAGISILTNGKLREIPLTVCQMARVDLIHPGKVSEADFALFLKQRGTAKAPKFDLNGDGKRDYLDDYIFTANYLVALEKEKAKKGEPSASQKTQKTRNGKTGSVKKCSTTRTAKITKTEGKSKE